MDPRETAAMLTSALLLFTLSIVHCAPTGNKTEILTLGDFEDSVSALPLIDLLRGRDGRDGLPGRDGKDGERGPQGEQGEQGEEGPPGARSAGVTYIRWGKSSCPNTAGTQLVYTGRAGGTAYNTQGGGVEKLCLPLDPDYIDSPNSIGTSSYSPTIQGAEYEVHSDPLHSVHDHNVPCTVCYASTRAAMIMVPAKTQCPSSWTREYYGYLMTERANHHRSSFDCVDLNSDIVPGGVANTNGALFYHVKSSCNGLQCPPYVNNRFISCAVCTK